MNTKDFVADFLAKGGQITKCPTVKADGAYIPGEPKPDIERAVVSGNSFLGDTGQRKKRGNPNFGKRSGPPGPTPTEKKLLPNKAEILADYDKFKRYAVVARKWDVGEGSLATVLKKWLAQEKKSGE